VSNVVVDSEEDIAGGPARRRMRGRPSSFDRDVALEAAMHVFWERGYEASSISDLVSAMGITPPVLYRAFRAKEQLFLDAVERYAASYGGIGARAWREEQTAREAVERWLTESANEFVQSNHPRGCMIVMAATNCTGAAQGVCSALQRRRADEAASMERRIRDAIESGELSPDVGASDLARFYSVVYQGMSIQAKDGVGRAALMATVRRAMKVWPVA
jgi:AcrR family transcriptional regulator